MKAPAPATATPPPVAAFAEQLARAAGALAVLFYGSNLRTGVLDGVLDFYVLLPGPAERGLWPRVSYHEATYDSEALRAKVATMTLACFAEAAAGQRLDTTIWARFTQPSALIWARDDTARGLVEAALRAARTTATRLAAALGPAQGTAESYWNALFAATYRAEFRVESGERPRSIYQANAAYFDAILPTAWTDAGIAFDASDGLLAPRLSATQRHATLAWWRRRRRAGKPLNLLRLLRAATTFAGAARYAAWKIERHTGMAVPLTPWRERHPLLAAPRVLWSLWRHRRSASPAQR